MSQLTTNYGLYSVPVAWTLAMLPHWYAIRLLSKNGVPGGFDNTNPRNQADFVKTKLSAEQFGRFQRAEAAQANGFDGLPLFAAAVGIASVARVPASTVNTCAGLYLASRVVFNLLYINTTDIKKSGLRSLTWLFGIINLLTLFVKAGQQVNSLIL
ncbi:hypothetical protein PYCC9005_003337 [Savitreella phatthalungensis]